MLRIGFIGGGEDSFIGAIHRMAARLDGKFEIVAGALSSDPERARRSGAAIGLASDRSYASYAEMIERESARPDGIDVVAIVTPNHLHHAPAKLALEKGFDVLIDKPLCFSLDEARELKQLVAKTKKHLALTYTYAGYPAVCEARQLVARGRLGRLRKVVVQYPQGWLSDKIEDTQQKQATWRTDPKRAGESCCFADIGTHAIQLAETISGQHVTQLLAELQTFVPGRVLDDDAALLLRFDAGLRGVAVASQICKGESNTLQIAFYGDKGGLRWTHASPNQLELLWPDRPKETLYMGVDQAYLHSETHGQLRTPAGHPEGYIEAFANIYKHFAEHIEATRQGKSLPQRYPGVVDGFRGMAVVEAALRSSRSGSVWTDVVLE